MKKKFVAYEGEELTIEWFFDDRGRSETLEYYTELPFERKKKLAHLFYLLGMKGEIKNKEKFRNEGDQIYALKPTPDRFLCFFSQDSKVIITNAFEKKTNKLPPREKERALKCKADYTKRCKEEIYYE